MALSKDLKQAGKETEYELDELNERVSLNYEGNEIEPDYESEDGEFITANDKHETVFDKVESIVLEESSIQISKQSLMRTLVAAGVSFMLMFGAFDAFSNLQSSLHTSDGLGTIGLALIYVFIITTSLFFTTLTLSRFHAKWIIVFSMLTYIVYMLTGFYPSWYTIIPASVVIGAGSSHLWLAVILYVTDIAKRFAALTQTKEQDRVNLFLGIFYGFMYTSQVWGNLISSLVFSRRSNNIQNASRAQCGSSFCLNTEGNNTTIMPPTDVQVNTFIGICVGLATTGIAVLVVFAATVKTGTQRRRTILETLNTVLKHIMSSRNQQLLILPSVFGGLWNGFVVGDFTMAYISCHYGIEHVGFVMITFGVGQSLCSVIFGKLSQYSGHFLIYVIGSVIEVGTLLALLLLTPGEQGYFVVFIIAALFGMGIAINFPIILSHYNAFMKEDLEAAHSSFRMLSSVGWAIALGYSSALCINYKIYVLLCVATLSLICIIILNCQGIQMNKICKR